MTKPTVCRPRFATPRSPERETRGAEVAAVALAFGVELMEWQKMVADVGSEMLPGTRTPAYRELIVTVPRQCGKTTLTLAFEIHRALMWGERQSIAYTAQTGHDAREKLLNDQVPLLDAPGTPVREAVRRIHRASGSEGVSFENGSRLFILNSGNDAGHGKVVDLAVIDEAFADVDDRREQSLLPAMITRSSGQILVISTAGTERSPFLRRKVDTGRAAVANGENEGIAYFEWSADEDADPGDIETW
jgi:phage terminase large subunit-like protein